MIPPALADSGSRNLLPATFVLESTTKEHRIRPKQQSERMNSY